jgi:hypothetical protein
VSKQRQELSLHEECKELSGWDMAIYDTELKIKATEGKLSGLKAALEVCKDRREKGEPFPGESTKQTEAVSK